MIDFGPIPLDQVAHELRGPHPWMPGAVFIGHPGLAEHIARAVEAFASPQDAASPQDKPVAKAKVCPLDGGRVVKNDPANPTTDLHRCTTCAELLWSSELVCCATDETVVAYLAENATNCPVCEQVGYHAADCRIGLLG